MGVAAERPSPLFLQASATEHGLDSLTACKMSYRLHVIVLFGSRRGDWEAFDHIIRISVHPVSQCRLRYIVLGQSR